jgi:hypothetical protein
LPPVSGIIAATSASTIAENIVKTPAIIHAAKIKPGEPKRAAISAGLIKIPEPIIVVITIAVAVDKPIVRLKTCLLAIVDFWWRGKRC